MKIPATTIFRIFTLLTSWGEKALDDGKISISEALSLIKKFAQILSVEVENDIDLEKKSEKIKEEV